MQKFPIIGIIGGRGILGKIFREHFEAAGFTVLISGRKPDGKNVLSTNALVKKADIVIVSVFLRDTEKVLQQVVPKMRKNQLLADFTSVKELPMKIMREAKSEVVGLHPMFGEVSTLRGKNIFAVVARGGKLWNILQNSFAGFGLNIHNISAKQHDELAAIHQSSTHLLSLAFAELLRNSKTPPAKIFEIASPSAQLFLLTTGRILNQNLEMYTDISLANVHAAKTIRKLAKIFSEIAETVEEVDAKKLLARFTSASKFFGTWSAFANLESGQIFENLKTPTKERKKQSKSLPKHSVAVFGKNTQTELAARDFLKRKKMDHPLASFTTISEIFSAVGKKRATFGIIPIENSTVGLVRETLLNLFEANGKIKIFAEFERKIEHALLSRSSKLANIEKVFAHPQAAAQSAKFLARRLPRAEIVAVENAGRALELAKNSANTAAITAAEFATGEINVLAKNIEDSAENATRFVAITKKTRNSQLATRNSKSAIAFFFRENRSGQLATALHIFAEQRVNLARLESIPTTKKRGEFFFFVEAERSKNLPNVLKQLSNIANTVELGSY